MTSSVDFQAHFVKQIGFILSSSQEYDRGNKDEGIRLAQAMRVLFHLSPGGNSHSLLSRLGGMTTPILSTNRRTRTDNPDGYWPGLVKIHLDVATITVTSSPILNTMPNGHLFVPFTTWWEDEVVFYGDRRSFKRKDLVLTAANKDGGAHVDDTLPPNYQWLLDGASFSFKVESPDGTKRESKLIDANLACLRQMAFEVCHSPELLKLADVDIIEEETDGVMI